VRSSGPGARALVFVVFLACLASAGAACSKPKSYMVLTLRSSDTAPIAGVTEVVVTVSQTPSFSETLTYVSKTPFVVNGGGDNGVRQGDLSVSFTGGHSGLVTLTVKVLDASGCVLGVRSDLGATIRQGDTASVFVGLEPQNSCAAPTDGGVVDAGGGGDVFPGCDPVPPTTCGQGQTCQIDCKTRMGECTDGGTGAPGAACATNADCAPGSQCFDYTATGCPVKICLRFCNGDNGCQATGNSGGADGGAASPSGTRSLCQGSVLCSSGPTAYHTCTFGCDPRQQAAAAGTSGCPLGLTCLVVGDMDQVDCACPGAKRTGTDGTTCTGGADCAPGFICNIMGTTQQCRGICRCDAVNMTCTAKTNDCPDGKLCTALQHDATFGVCL
jgi:hypothetical protein